MLDFLASHWALSFLFLGFLVWLAIDARQQAKQGPVRLSPGEVTHWINRQGAVVVDIRDQASFRQGHIVNAVCCPFEQLKADTASLKKYQTKPIIIVCFLGRSSLQAVELLKKQGFSPVLSLEGGMKAWQEVQLPVVREA